jgi:two-component system, OmpR family, KDP operon response regulator KdpE
MSAGRILVVDDEAQIRRVMRTALSGRGYEVGEARSGEEAVEKTTAEEFNLVLLDVNMPGMGGLEACKAIRGASDVAIIMLTVRNAERDKIEALDAGADDYVTKPFSTPELLARIRAALRRSAAAVEDALSTVALNEELAIDFQQRRVTVKGKESHLTPKELDLLRYLVGHANQSVSHRELLQAVWGPEYGDELEYLRVFVNQLRKKIEPKPAKPQYLLTEPWFGYRFCLPSYRPSKP